MQSIGQAFGGNVVRAPMPVHGKLSEITHQGQGVFRGINGRSERRAIIRSWSIAPRCRTTLAVTAETATVW